MEQEGKMREIKVKVSECFNCQYYFRRTCIYNDNERAVKIAIEIPSWCPIWRVQQKEVK
jgi:hypothetical protein